MKRSELMEKLKRVITSFKYEYKPYGDEVVDKDADKSWLFQDDWSLQDKLPEHIPANYLVGEQYDVDGETYVVTSNENMEWLSKEKSFCKRIPDGREIALEVTDFGQFGNYHKYGKLVASGVAVKQVGELGNAYTSRLREKNPLLRHCWEIELRKIFTDKDKSKGDWEGYEEGMSVGRFSEYVDLYATAAYVSLLRFEGAFLLFEGSYCIVPEKEDVLLVVDGDEVVEIGDKLQSILKIVED